ncbi:Uncharacterised protein [Acinetobacter baumannii]|uniref:hypothetical protein n=1 Tax=Acinetobacter baumannii TaxID=470 RepID=UPI000E167947|nr:hypothetical protein [Acinetobacter baumannii]SUU42186.1 Uncharacterised protein [Acinetobacter baumannii]
MDKCREAFERFECEKYEANYDDMKKNWDWYESQFGYRYSPDSLRGKDWAIWQEAWQHQQAKVEELQKQLNEYMFVAETIDEMYVKEVQKSDELQKRVQFLEQELGAWKGKSIAAMINGMCKQCGKEPWQAIVSDKDGYALLHCFGCGANKYELVGEQALNGDQYDEHCKKAEDAISNGASLTKHRIEL